MAHDVTCSSCCEVVLEWPEAVHYKALEGFEAECKHCGHGACSWSPVDEGAVAVFRPYHEVCDADCGNCEQCTIADIAMRLARRGASLRALCAPQDPTELDPEAGQTEPAPFDWDEWDEPTLPSVQMFWEPVEPELATVCVYRGRVSLMEAV